MPDVALRFDNPIAALIALLLVLLLGVGGGGAIVTIRRDIRDSKREEIDLTAIVRGVAAETIGDLRKDVDELRGRVGALERELDRAYVIIRSAVGYAHTLLGYIALHLPHRTDVPRVPPILNDYISDRAVPILQQRPGKIDSESGSA